MFTFCRDAWGIKRGKTRLRGTKLGKTRLEGKTRLQGSAGVVTDEILFRLCSYNLIIQSQLMPSVRARLKAPFRLGARARVPV